jgi:hypothetical protein
MLTADITQDYKVFDFLQPVTYYVRTADSVWDGGHTVANCWFQDTIRSALTDGCDLKKKYGALTIWMKEWFDDTLVPKRGDKFVIAEVQAFSGGSTTTSNTYIVENVDVDAFRSQAMRLTAFRIGGS